MPKTETLRWSAITLLKDTFRPSNIDILKPKGISFPTMYNTKCPTFDTKLTQSHGLKQCIVMQKNSEIFEVFILSTAAITEIDHFLYLREILFHNTKMIVFQIYKLYAHAGQGMACDPTCTCTYTSFCLDVLLLHMQNFIRQVNRTPTLSKCAQLFFCK